MSRQNVEIVRRVYEATGLIGRTGGEFVDPEEVAPDVWSLLTPDFELHEIAELPDAKVHRGRDAAKEFFRKTQEVFSEMRWEPREIVDLGDVVVVETKLFATGRHSNVQTEVTEADVFWFRDGMIARLQPFPSMDAALEAVGLSKQDAHADHS